MNPLNHHTANPKLSAWLERIREQEMPIFGHTVQGVLSVADDDQAPAAELARVVLQDASMTARVLKLANTIYYNPREQGISTVSRAVVVLGFNTVRNMCLSISLVDSLVQGNQRERLIQELARSIHAAVQARSLALARGDLSPEEVFIATLLYRLGDMAFWCFSGEVGDQLDAIYDRPGYTREEAEREVLGFTLRELTAGLAQEWHLNELLRESLLRPERAGARGKNVTLCHDLAVAAEQHGWGATETQQVVGGLARLTGDSLAATSALLHRNAREAIEIARYYGAATAAHTIPLPGHAQAEQEPEAAEEQPPRYPEPDSLLQLRILRELSALVEERTDFNLMMELVLEGIYRGVGMDRTLFALLTPDRAGLKAKFVLGEHRTRLAERFQFIRDPKHPNLFFAPLDDQRPRWVDLKTNPELRAELPDSVIDVLGTAPFFLAPIVVRGKAIGLFYADRAPSGRELDKDSYESFKHFCKQADMGLTLMATRR